MSVRKHTELCCLKSQVAVCSREKDVADLEEPTAMTLGFGKSGREEVCHDGIATGVATFDSREALRAEGRERSKNSKLLRNYMTFKQPQPNAPSGGGEIR